MKKYVYPDNGKFIYKHGNSYHIIKKSRVNGKMKQKHYGSFKDYNEAIRYRDKCVANNWDIPKYENPMKHITRNGKGWQIQRDCNGKHEYYGQFSNLTDAMNERDLLVANDWDIEKVCELTDDTINGVSLMRGRRV